MNTLVTYRSPIPHRTIVVWDAKYRKEGGTYPSSLDSSKIERWKHEIQVALYSPDESLTGRISGPRLSHINASIAEFNAYRVMLENGHYGIRPPGRPTAVGADFITYFHGSPLLEDIKVAVSHALSTGSIVGRIFRWPECIVTG